MNIMNIMSVMNIMNISAWMAMAGAFSALVLIKEAAKQSYLYLGDQIDHSKQDKMDHNSSESMAF